jgi:hypothetical protein
MLRINIFFALCYFLNYSVRAQQAVLFQGQLQSTDGSPVRSIPLNVQYKLDGQSAFENILDLQTDNDGRFSFNVSRETLYKIDLVKVTVIDGSLKITDPPEGMHPPLGERPAGQLRLQQYQCEAVDPVLNRLKETIARITFEKEELESKIERLELRVSLTDERNDSTVYNLYQLQQQLAEKESRIDQLTDSIRQKIRKELLTSLGDFRDDLLNLEQNLDRHTIRDAFYYPGTQQQLYKIVQEYENQRAKIAGRRNYFLSEVSRLWGEGLSLILKEVYFRSLEVINQELLVNRLNPEVLQQIDAVTKQQKPRILIQPKAVKASEEIQSDLRREIRRFEEQLDFLQQKFESS